MCGIIFSDLFGMCKKMRFKISVFGSILLVAGLLMIIAVFLSWFSYSAFSISGWEIFTDSVSDSFRSNIPFLMLVFGIAAIMLAFFDLVGMERIMVKVLALFLGIVGMILILSFLAFDFSYLGIGVYLEIIALIVLIVVPILGLLKILPEVK
jgi:hypothetical protein